MFDIDLWLTEHDDGYKVLDWFRGGQATLDAAADADTAEAADAILRAAYLGPDSDGVEVKWNIA